MWGEHQVVKPDTLYVQARKLVVLTELCYFQLAGFSWNGSKFVIDGGLTLH